MMAPHPCALAISRRVGGTFEDASETESRAATLAALSAALDLWKEIGRRQILERSQDLAARFISRLDSGAVIAGGDTDLESSNIVVVQPRLGMRWQARSAVTLLGDLRRARIHAAVVEPQPGKLWLKFALPYCVEGTDVERAASRLRGLLELEESARVVSQTG
jgi:hypothetical protein